VAEEVEDADGEDDGGERIGADGGMLMTQASGLTNRIRSWSNTRMAGMVMSGR
jgi:hypothetical protein